MATDTPATVERGRSGDGSVGIGRIAGIDVRVNHTWLLAFALVTWSLAAGFFPAEAPGLDTATYWMLGAVAALCLFASVLVHEVSHSLVAKARGLDVESITLFIFGGVSNITEEAEEPRDEFLIAIVGPLTSFALAAMFWFLGRAIVPEASAVGALIGYLAVINALLGGFNLLPGFPLDGGRVFRSIIWAISGNLRTATRIASYAGQGFGFLLILAGVAQIFGGNLLGGMWMAFIGWFLNGAAESTRRQQEVREDLRGIAVERVMDPTPPTADPQVTVRDFVFEEVLRRGRRAVLVVDDGRLAGIASVTDAKDVPQERWSETTLREVMTPVPLRSLRPSDDLAAALKLLVEGALNQAPVLDDGRLVGMLSRADILRILQLRDDLHLDLRRRRARLGRRDAA